ncbi:MAG: flagellin [Alphaproteobacteria bacterium]|nr:flagellin [Alphaproteobacteria bacterium]
MANSVNSNMGATIALQSLNRTNSELASVQKRVSTGFRVSDAKDDGAAFAVAQGLRADVKGNEAVGERLSVTKGLLSVTQEALKGISESVGDIKKVLVKLGDANLSSDERTQYQNDYLALTKDIEKYIGQATFGGNSLLDTSTATSVISDSSGGTISLTEKELGNTATGALRVNGLVGANDTATLALIDTSAEAIAKLGETGGSTTELADFEKAVNDQLAAVGANSRTVENQDAFIKVLADTISDGIGSIVDADLAKESAKLQALQIRQQLGTQTLSIANQSPSILLSLFK